MMKSKVISAVILTVVLFIVISVGPLSDHISYKLRYGVWEGHMDRAGEAFLIQEDYETAYKEASAAYDSLKTETPVDIGLKASTCLYMADILEACGDDEELLSVLERGYEDTEDGAIYERLAPRPVSFVNKNIQALICESVGVTEDALTYADLQRWRKSPSPEILSALCRVKSRTPIRTRNLQRSYTVLRGLPQSFPDAEMQRLLLKQAFPQTVIYPISKTSRISTRFTSITVPSPIFQHCPKSQVSESCISTTIRLPTSPRLLL